MIKSLEIDSTVGGGDIENSNCLILWLARLATSSPSLGATQTHLINIVKTPSPLLAFRKFQRFWKPWASNPGWPHIYLSYKSQYHRNQEHRSERDQFMSPEPLWVDKFSVKGFYPFKIQSEGSRTKACIQTDWLPGLYSFSSTFVQTRTRYLLWLEELPQGAISRQNNYKGPTESEVQAIFQRKFMSPQYGILVQKINSTSIPGARLGAWYYLLDLFFEAVIALYLGCWLSPHLGAYSIEWSLNSIVLSILNKGICPSKDIL